MSQLVRTSEPVPVDRARPLGSHDNDWALTELAGREGGRLWRPPVGEREVPIDDLVAESLVVVRLNRALQRLLDLTL